MRKSMSAGLARAGRIAAVAAVLLVLAIAAQPLWGEPLIGRHFP